MSDTPDNIVPISGEDKEAAKQFIEQSGRELVTILFTDLVDSTQMQSDLGNEEAARITVLHRELVREELKRYEAREIEWAGDSCLAVFSKPSDAVVFALRMQAEHARVRKTEKRLPTVRVGMHLGEIVVKQGDHKEDLYGLQVSEAARVMSIARGNQVFCTRAVFDSARSSLKGQVIDGIGDAVWVNYGAYLLKGSDEPVEICEIGSSEVAVMKAPEATDKVFPLLPGGMPSATAPGTPKWAVAMLVLLLIGVSVLTGNFALNTRGGERRATSTDTPIRSLAVLPFDNNMGDAEKEYYVDGMTDTLTAELSKIDSIKVIARTSAMRFKGSDRPLREIASELGVEGLIEGSVQMFGDELRITAQLVDGRTEEHLWGDNFDGTFEGVMKLQGDVAIAVADQIGAVLTSEERDDYASAKDVNREAYDLYLRGRSIMQTRRENDLRIALNLFDESLKIDSEFALPHAGKSDAYTLMKYYRFTDGDENKEKAFRHARRAIELDGSLGAAYASLGWAHTRFDVDENWATARRVFQTAVDLDPSMTAGRSWYGWLLVVLGETDEGLVRMARAAEIDPFDPIVWSAQGIAYSYADRFDEAEKMFGRALEVDPESVFSIDELSKLYSKTGRLAEAIELAEKLNVLSESDNSRSQLAMLRAAAEGQNALAEFVEDVEQGRFEDFDPSLLVHLYFAVGMTDKALEVQANNIRSGQEDAMRTRTMNGVFTLVSSDEERRFIHNEDRFWEILSEYDLPPLPTAHPLYQREYEYELKRAAEVVLAAQPKPVKRYTIPLDPKYPVARSFSNSPENISVAPDDSALYYVATVDGTNQIIERRLDRFSSKVIDGGEDATWISLSPGGTKLAFIARNGVWMLPVEGGVAQKLVDYEVYVPTPGFVWHDESAGYISTFDQGLLKINVEAGERQILIPPGPNRIFVTTVHSARNLLSYFEFSSNQPRKLKFFDLESKVSEDVEGNFQFFQFLWDEFCGGLTFGDGVVGPVFVSKFDFVNRRFFGEKYHMAGDDAFPQLGSSATGSPSGNFYYVRQPTESGLASAPPRGLVWVDLEGHETPVDIPQMPFFKARLWRGDDEVRVAVCLEDSSDIWVMDANESLSRFTHLNNLNTDPYWSADGSTIYFRSSNLTRSAYQLYRKPYDLSRNAEPVLELVQTHPYDWTTDGKSMIVTQRDRPEQHYRLGLLHMDDSARFESKFESDEEDIYGPALSPDGKWLAYRGIKDGEDQVYVRSWPELELVGQITREGGRDPVWSADGRTLYYRSETHMMALPIRDTAAFAWGEAKELFLYKYLDQENFLGRMYDFDPVGERFLMIERPAQTEFTEIVVVENWMEEVKEQLAAAN